MVGSTDELTLELTGDTEIIPNDLGYINYLAGK
jgi:hypothetical protein